MMYDKHVKHLRWQEYYYEMDRMGNYKIPQWLQTDVCLLAVFATAADPSGG